MAALKFTSRQKANIRRNLPLYTMFLPVILFFAVFKFLPMAGYLMAFQDFKLSKGIWDSPFIGWTNFSIMFGNPIFCSILKNTLLISIGSLIVGFPAPIILALLLNEVANARVKKLYQTVVFMPHFLNWVVVGTFVIMLFSQESGMINAIIERLGGERTAFLYTPQSWFVIYFLTDVWKNAGWGAVIYMAAISSISPEQYESALIDGASRFQRMLHITLPSLVPIITIKLILSVESVMQVGFDQIYVMSNSAVAQLTNVISVYSYNAAKSGRNFGITTAMGLVESGIGMALMICVNALARRTEHQLW